MHPSAACCTPCCLSCSLGLRALCLRGLAFQSGCCSLPLTRYQSPPTPMVSYPLLHIGTLYLATVRAVVPPLDTFLQLLDSLPSGCTSSNSLFLGSKHRLLKPRASNTPPYSQGVTAACFPETPFYCQLSVFINPLPSSSLSWISSAS